MDGTPPVSCMCLTYGRPDVLEEAVYSFINQDYTGVKELIILNDLVGQTLQYDHPEVKIINVPKRFNSVGEKRNACAALATHDILFVWDDDDIYLPHRISYSIKSFDVNKGYFKPTSAFTFNNKAISNISKNLFHSSSCWTRSLFNRAHGYSHIGSGQDMDLEMAFDRMVPKKNSDIPPADLFYIYRWGGTGSYHLSAFGRDKTECKTGNKKVEEYVSQRLENGQLKSGTVILEPKWLQDYTSLAQDFTLRLRADIIE